MKYDLDKIWQELGIDRKVSSVYHEFCFQAGRYIAMLHDPQKDIKNVRVKNPFVYTQLKSLLENFKKQYELVIRTAIVQTFELADKKNDSILMKLVKAAGVMITGERLLKIFNRVHKDDLAEITIDTVLKYARNTEGLAAFLSKELTFSPRVWNLTKLNQAVIKHYIASGMSQGRAAIQIAGDLKSLLNNPDARFRRIRNKETGKLMLSQPMKDYHPGRGVYRSAFQNARRLAATEINMAYRRADLYRWRNLDFIMGYEVHTSARHDITDICDDMKGKYPKTFTFVGWHPLCRCYCTSILPSDDQFIKYLNTDKVPGGLQVKGIPQAAFNYIKDNSASLAKLKTEPFFIRDNFTKRKGIYYPKKSIG